MSPEPASPPHLSREQVESFVTRFAKSRVTVLGDVMLDRYFWGDVERISPEAPVPIVHVTRRSKRLGGAANVAANLRELGLDVAVVGVTGKDRAGEGLRGVLVEHGIDANGLVAHDEVETTEKVRIIARNQQVVRADFESDDAIDDSVRAHLLDALSAEAARSGALVVSDYGKGVLAEHMLRDVIALWRRAGKHVLVDPHVPHFRWYRGASVITPNTREANLAAGIDFRKGREPSTPAFAVIKELELEALLVTRGEEGMSLFTNDGRQVHVPTVAKEVYDVTGAGDTVISVLAAALSTGVELVDGVVIANQAAGEVVKEVGTTTITADALIRTFA